VVVGRRPTGGNGRYAGRDRAAHLARRIRHIDPASARIILLEGGPRVLPAMPEAESERACEQLACLGVDVRLMRA
jgi:NADH dehydrogenase